MVQVLNALPQHSQTFVFANYRWSNIERTVHFDLLSATATVGTPLPDIKPE
jgi:hypothetical protein